MTGIEDLPPLREIIRTHGLSARKSLGQNFILDLNITRRIARLAGPLEGLNVIEIGPGPGGLTRALILEGAKKVIAVERDDRCVAALAGLEQASGGRLQILAEDALSLDYSRLLAGPTRVVANLPYAISTALLTKWIDGPDWPPWYLSLTLMFQREVGERIVAAPGEAAYGRLSVLVGWRCEATIVYRLPASAFTPAPKVDSAVVHIVPRAAPYPCRPRDLSRVTAAAFGQRRKMLRSSLKPLFKDPSATLEKVGIAPSERAENVSIEKFCRLAELYAAEGRKL